MSAKEAFKAYVRAYDSHHLKQIFDIETLDLAKVAKSFGFIVPPAVDLSKRNILLIYIKKKYICRIYIYNTFAMYIEVGVSKAARPRKRLGGGGYGQFKNINDPSSAKQLRRTKTFRQVGKRGKDNRQFSR